jgi:hypothetical protein
MGLVAVQQGGAQQTARIELGGLGAEQQARDGLFQPVEPWPHGPEQEIGRPLLR